MTEGLAAAALGDPGWHGASLQVTLEKLTEGRVFPFFFPFFSFFPLAHIKTPNEKVSNNLSEIEKEKSI